MPLASGASARILYTVEATRGTANTTASAQRELRLTERAAPQIEVNEITSNEVTTARQQSSARPGTRQVSGQLGFEFAWDNQRGLIEVMTNQDFVTTALSATTHDIGPGGVTANEITLTSVGTAYDDELLVGDVVHFTQASSQWAAFGTVTSITSATVMTVRLFHFTTGTLTDVDDTDDNLTAAVFERSYISGSDHRSLTIERQFTDVPLYQQFVGCCVNDFSISASPEQLATGTWSIVGISAGQLSGTSSFDGTDQPAYGANSNAYSPFSTSIFIDTAASAVATAVELNVTNNRSTTGRLGDPFSPDVFEGVAEVSGSVTFLFESANEYNLLINENEVPMSILFHDNRAIGWSALCMERVIFTGASSEVPSTGPVTLTLNFRSLEGAGQGTISGTSLSFLQATTG